MSRRSSLRSASYGRSRWASSAGSCRRCARRACRCRRRCARVDGSMRRLIIPAGGAAMLGAALLSPAAVDFEVPAAEPAAASLTPTQIAGEGFHIQNPVHSDGLMHHYVVESRFGLFTAYGRDALAVRLREVAAL